MHKMYTSGVVDIGISVLRAQLSSWIERVQAGEEVVITERGTPVARLVPIDSAPLLEELTRRGVLSRARSDESRPAARTVTRAHTSGGSVSELISEQRG